MRAPLSSGYHHGPSVLLFNHLVDLRGLAGIAELLADLVVNGSQIPPEPAYLWLGVGALADAHEHPEGDKLLLVQVQGNLHGWLRCAYVLSSSSTLSSASRTAHSVCLGDSA